MLGTFKTPKQLSVELRLMTRYDLELLVAIESGAHETPWSEALFSDCLGGRQQCYVAFSSVENATQIIAYIVLTLAGPDAEILNITVAKKWQKKTIGRSLLQRTIKALGNSCDTIYLEVRESNAQAIALYSSEGFVEVGVRSGYYPSKKGREDAIIFAYTIMDRF